MIVFNGEVFDSISAESDITKGILIFNDGIRRCIPMPNDWYRQHKDRYNNCRIYLAVDRVYPAKFEMVITIVDMNNVYNKLIIPVQKDNYNVSRTILDRCQERGYIKDIQREVQIDSVGIS